MAISIGPKGYIDIISAGEGPERGMRVIAFPGRGDTGFIVQPQFRTGENPFTILDMQTGTVVTTAFDTTVANGGINQTDTGADFAGHTLFAMTTDTGTAGL